MTEGRQNSIGLNLESTGMTDEEYRKLWDLMGKFEVRCIEKNGRCRHNVAETHYYDTMPYRLPEGVCYARLHVLDLYTWRIALSFPSWKDRNRDVYTVHCPDRTGTAWELRKVQ